METVTIVSKIGGSLISGKSREVSNVDKLLTHPEIFISLNVVDKIAKEFSKALKYFERNDIEVRLWLSHGVGVYGHHVVEKYKVSPKVREYTNYLYKKVEELFIKHGVPVVQLDAAKTVFPTGNGFDVDKLIGVGEKIISRGKIPFSYGTVVGTKEMKIFSADDFVENVATKTNANLALMFMDVPLSTEDPKINPQAKPLKELKNMDELQISMDPHDKSGGLLAKIKKLQNVHRSGKTKCRIVNGMKEGNVYKSLIGKKVPAEILID